MRLRPFRPFCPFCPALTAQAVAAAVCMLPLAGLAQPVAPSVPAAAGPSPEAAAPAAPAPAAPLSSTPPSAAPALQPSTALGALPRNENARTLPIVLRAREISAQIDQQAVARGEVEFRRGGVVIRADELTYNADTDVAQARGHVRVSRDGAVYSGPALSVAVQRFEGSFTEPAFEFLNLGVGGKAERLDLLGPSKAMALGARYSSCRPTDEQGAAQEPAWELRTRKVTFDTAANEGVAEGARLRFLGTTILALPTMSFPLSDSRKSGWLPPSVTIDNRSGIELSVPYYWNLAPNYDLTLAPRLITRRGLGLDTEARYLQPRHEGVLAVDWLPSDRVAGRERHSVHWQHEQRLPGELRFNADVLRVSDADWWKDFPNAGRSFTSRLLPTRLSLERTFELAPLGASGLAYARATQWQVLQAADSFITSPYQRAPQLGLRLQGQQAGFEASVETEFNRFSLPAGQPASTQRSPGDRWHLLASVSRPFREPGWWLVPRLGVNAASYSAATTNTALVRPFDGARRVIPSFSVDAGLELERSTEAFGRVLHQTLEPRLLYVNTPYREQSRLPNYDAAAKDFNFVSIYSDNSFSGIDRVSDAHQLTAGLTTRLVDAKSGAEALRLGLVQRYLFRTQRVAPQADGSPDGPPLEQRFSDALLLGSTSVLPGWTLDAAVQYSPDINRSVRSILGARYSPGPFRTVGATYRLARGLSEQVELGWQWPLYGAGARWGGGNSPGAVAAAEAPRLAGRAAAGPGGCNGTWYGVGRLNYSMKDRRITDSVLGLEYDAGCWIARFVAEQQSIGRSEATTRYLIQLELVGLSRLGSNPLKVLKDNIPGYQLLREDRSTSGDPRTDRSTLSPFYE